MTTATAVDFAQFTVEMDEVGSSYPSIQATQYQPRSLKEKVELCLAESSMDLLSEEVAAEIAALTTADTAIFDDEGTETAIFKLQKDVRFVVLGMPSIFHLDKNAEEILPKSKKRNLKGSNIVTITRLPMVMIKPDNTLVMDGDTPQIFTLKLKSSKTMLVTGNRKDKEFKSLRDVQKGLQKHYGLSGKQACLHLASVKIAVTPQVFSNGKDSSIGILYTLDGGAKELPKELWPITFSLMQDEETLRLLKDPFGLDGVVASSQSGDDGDEDASTEVYDGEISF